MPSSNQDPRALGRFLPAAVCAVLLIVFAAVSYSAVLTKNATIDEPAHSLSGWLEIRRGDFRFETVNPSLWKMWAALGNVGVTPRMTFDGPVWQNLTWDAQGEVIWACRTLYQTPGTDADGFINRSRGMMLILAVATGALLARWSYRLAGPVTAVVATFLFCADPTVLAHAPLVKSDVAFGLVLLALARATWSLGKKITVGQTLLVGLLCGIELNVKFSGVIVGPILAGLMVARAVMPTTWDGSKFGRSMAGRLLLGAGVGVVAVGMCLTVTWAAYGFRFRVAPSPAVRMNLDAILYKAARAEAGVSLKRIPTDADLAQWPQGPTERAVVFADRHHLLPEAFLAGLLYQHVCVTTWPGFLDGDYFGAGRWDYFPKAFVYKTPLAELAVLAISTLVLVVTIRRARSHVWTVVCIAIPVVIFSAAALTTHLNIGLRNILPIYPFLFLSIGVAASIAWQRRPRLTAIVGTVLAIFIVTADMSAWPDYIPFFNSVFGAESNGLNHLTDSNLDWGQDVRQLADWQKAHPDVPIYTSLFTTVDPGYYGVRCTPVSDKTEAGPPGVLAISATHLQGLYLSDPAEKRIVEKARQNPPIAVLGGGTIYLFRYPER